MSAHKAPQFEISLLGLLTTARDLPDLVDRLMRDRIAREVLTQEGKRFRITIEEIKDVQQEAEDES